MIHLVGFLALPLLASGEVTVSAQLVSDNASEKVIEFLECSAIRTGSPWRWASPSEEIDFSFQEKGGKIALTHEGQSHNLDDPSGLCKRLYPVALGKPFDHSPERFDLVSAELQQPAGKWKRWLPWAAMGVAVAGATYFLQKQKGPQGAYLH